MPSILNGLTVPFRSEEVISKPLLCLFILLNGIVLTNACVHNPTVGYDAAEHLKYIRELASLHLPKPAESSEFFSPPLPSIFPALLGSSGLARLWWAAKAAQLLNAALSIGLTFYLLKICDLIRPHSSHFKGASLFVLAMLPVYYKTFVFVRGEPFVVLFVVL